jgi:hypothetical protein
MTMQTFEGYFVEKDKFVPLCDAAIPMRKRAIVTVLDEPAKEESQEDRMAEISELIAFIRANAEEGEEIPELEAINFDREINL